MKKILVAVFVLLMCHTIVLPTQNFAQQTQKQASKDKDGIDGRMKGPNGEVVYIGEKGGRYYINSSGNKVYLPYGKNKAKKKIEKNIKAVIKQATK